MIARLTVWFALASWLLELGLLTARAVSGNQLRILHPASALFGPIVTLATFAAVGLILLLVCKWVPPRYAVTLIPGSLLTLLFAHTTLEYVGRLHTLPAIILAAGLGVVVSRAIVPRLQALIGIVRRTTLPLTSLVVLLAVAPLAVNWMSERSTLTGLPEPDAPRPNVLLIILDTVRAMSMGLYQDGTAATPNLEDLAKRGTLFSRAISTSPWTLPSHASMFTGRYVFELSTNWEQPFVDADSTLAEVLSARGFVTAGFVANLYYASRPLGLARGFAHFEDFPFTTGQAVLSTSLGRAITNGSKFRRLTGFEEVLNRKTAAHVVDDFLSWTDGWLESGRDNPFFAFLNLFDAHEPYLPPEPFRSDYSRPGPAPTYWYGTNLASRNRKEGLDPAEIAPQLGAYEGTIAYIDDQLGRLFRELGARGLTENTIVIVTSDHGEEFGEHGVMGHSRSLYLPLLHVPLVLVWPQGLAQGRVIDEEVSLRDLPSTVLDLLGLESSNPIPGNPWTGIMSGDPRQEEAALLSEVTSYNRARTLFQDPYHYIRFAKNGVLEEELYNVRADPLEQVDLADSEAFATVLEDMRRRTLQLTATARSQ